MIKIYKEKWNLKNACEKSISPAEIQSEDQSFSKSQFQPSTSQDIPKVLGIPWNNSTDQLEFTFEGLASYLEEKIVTKSHSKHHRQDIRPAWCPFACIHCSQNFVPTNLQKRC